MKRKRKHNSDSTPCRYVVTMSFECEAHEAPQCRLQVQKYTKNNFSSTSIDNRWEEKLTNTKTCVSSLILWHFAARFETMTTFSHHHHCSHCCSVNSLDVDEHYCNLSRLSLNCFSTSSDAHRRKCQLHHIDYCGESMGKLIIIFTILKIIKVLLRVHLLMVQVIIHIVLLIV